MIFIARALGALALASLVACSGEPEGTDAANDRTLNLVEPLRVEASAYWSPKPVHLPDCDRDSRFEVSFTVKSPTGRWFVGKVSFENLVPLAGVTYRSSPEGDPGAWPSGAAIIRFYTTRDVAVRFRTIELTDGSTIRFDYDVKMWDGSRAQGSFDVSLDVAAPATECYRPA